MRVISRLLNQGFTEPKIWERSDNLFFTGRTGERETIGNDVTDYIRRMYKANGPVFTCIMVRQMVFSEARFQYRRFQDGRPTPLFDDPSLRLLERPWPNATTGELLSRMEQDGSLAGNFYATPVGREDDLRLRRMFPGWVTILTGVHRDELTSDDEDPSPYDLRARPVLYIYKPVHHKAQPQLITPDRMVHYSPIPDPEAQWRGMSWLTPVIDEVLGDKASTKHKLKFFQNGAVPGLAVTYDKSVSVKAVREYAAFIQEQYEGLDNAYKTLHMGGGADPKPMGANLRQLDFKVTQGASESRIAAASGLGAVMAQFSEGLAGSSLNTGNFTAARKRAETTLFRPLWRMAAASLQSVLGAPEGAELTYDARDIAFLRDDALEEANIRQKDSFSIRNLTDAGFKPESVIAAINAGNYSLLEHTGLFSVQLQPPNSNDPNDRVTVSDPGSLATLLRQGYQLVKPDEPEEGSDAA